jgi:hypothetical protein
MPRLISARTVALVRRTAERTLTDVCTIEKLTGSRGTMGEPLDDWVLVAEDVPCRIITAGTQSTSKAEAVGGQEALKDLHECIVPVGTSIDVDHRVITGGVTYEVVALETALTDAAFVKVLVSRAR